MKTGILIAFEGGEGCGKTTVSKWLVQELKKRGFPTIWTREPGGTKCPTSEKIRKILLDLKNNICPITEAFLFAASRAQHIKELIRPNLERGINVVSDRFVLSSYVYQGIGRKIGLSPIIAINDFACQRLKPNITFLLDLDIKIGQQRTAEKKKDRLEGETPLFHQRNRRGYLQLAREDPRIIIINAELPLNQVRQEVLEQTLKIIKKRRK